jgi:hypothetical protein
MNYPIEAIPKINYTYSLKQDQDKLQVIGKAQESLRIDISEKNDYMGFETDIAPAEKVAIPQVKTPEKPVQPAPVKQVPTEPISNPNSKYFCNNMVQYADQFVQKSCPYRLWCNWGAGCVPANPNTCSQVGLTCATFVDSLTLLNGVALWGNGGQVCKLNSGQVTILKKDVTKLQPGDIFQAGGEVGHTGMFVGRGKLGGTEKVYFSGTRHCYTKYQYDPNGRYVFVHSIGNSEPFQEGRGWPGACYEYYEDLFASGRSQVTQFCRLNVCNGRVKA